MQKNYTLTQNRIKDFLAQHGLSLTTAFVKVAASVTFICTALVGCGGGGASTKTSVTQTVMTVASTTYSLQSLPLSGLVTYHDASNITYYADSAGSAGSAGFLVLLGNFTYPSSITSVSTTLLPNLSGISGTITGVAQYDSTKKLQMSITPLSISASKNEGYIEAVDYYDLWQSMIPSAGLYISAAATITCQDPVVTGGLAQSFLTTANQNIASSLSSCKK